MSKVPKAQNGPRSLTKHYIFFHVYLNEHKNKSSRYNDSIHSIHMPILIDDIFPYLLPICKTL